MNNNETHKRNKKSLFERLKSNKRSTKIEPASTNCKIINPTVDSLPGIEYDDDFNINNHPEATTSAQSTPTKQNNLHSSHNNNNNFQISNRHIRRRSDSDNIHTIAPTTATTTTTTTNRHSHHFSLCCSLPVDVKENSITPKLPIKHNSITKSINEKQNSNNNVKVTTTTTSSAPICIQYDPLGTAELRKEIAKIRECDISQVQQSIRKTISSKDDNNDLNNYHTNDILSSIPPPQMTMSQPSSPSIRAMKSATIFAQQLSPPSIAMTACRSRLKEKLLPPSPPPTQIHLINPSQFLSPVDNAATLSSRLHPTTNQDQQQQQQQHSSSPNISHNNQNNISIENRLNGQPPIRMYNGHGNNNNTNKYDDDRIIRDNRKKSYSYDILSGVNRFQSTDSLAKQSLVAANVFNLIPMERARERNFLSGRLAANSLLGSAELDRVLPAREIKIFVGTWNMNGQNPPKQMNDFVLPTSIEHVPDLVCIGTQESCSERFEWEVTLQETLGPTHILLHSTALGTLHLAVFIRRDLIWFCSQPEEDSLSVRPGSAFRTKGAIAISFSLFGTSMLFVTSHLTAHEQKVKERVSDVKRIIHALDLPRNLNLRNKNKDVTQNFDAVYWCGDLNFRLGEPREKILKWIETTQFPLPSHLPHGYMHTDQLKSILENGAAFKDFQEANITFPPTYKFDPGTQQFDTSSKQRAPAYTDRILYKYKTGRRCSTFTSNYNYSNSNYLPQVECLLYDSVPSILTSDHKPVWALFKNALRPGIDSIPLAAGLFNRDVYVEGMKRRLNNINTGSSGVCSIQ